MRHSTFSEEAIFFLIKLFDSLKKLFYLWQGYVCLENIVNKVILGVYHVTIAVGNEQSWSLKLRSDQVITNLLTSQDAQSKF